MSESGEGNRYLGMRVTVSSLKFMNSKRPIPMHIIIKVFKVKDK